MCCFKKRKTPAKVIFVLAGIASVMAICMIAFAFLLTNNDVLKNMEKEDDDLKDARQLLFLVLLCFALAIIAVAALSFFLRCISNRCYVMTYGCILLPSWIIVVIFGAIATAISIAAEDTIQDECIKALAEAELSTDSSTLTYSLNIYETLKIDEYMCTDFCPCKTSDKDSQFSGKRTFEGVTYTRGPFEYTYYNKDNFAGNFTNYVECLKNPTVGVAETQGTVFEPFADELTSQDVF